MGINEILQGNNIAKKKALFTFDKSDSNEKVVFKFNLWARYFNVKYFASKDAPFHSDIDRLNLSAYRGEINRFTDIAFRGGAKTARTKLFIAYAISNDLDNHRKYIKILSEDKTNSKQIVTDIYNIFIKPEMLEMYPEIFKKTTSKREETMSAFTTSTGVKLLADTVGTDQRGALQENARPDLIWFEDFENRKTLRSAVITKSIWDNMEEARTSLAKGGACIDTCNYISEAGNVHKLVEKVDDKNIVLITPIIKNGIIAWDRYSAEDIKQMERDDDDFDGERMCNPSSGIDVYFPRDILEKMDKKEPIRTSVDFRIYHEFDASHRYGSGHDIAKGVGLDSSTSVFIDFHTFPARVVASFNNNLIKPETFGDEIYRQQEMFGGCIAGIENNYGSEAILRMKQLGGNMYKTVKDDKSVSHIKTTDYGWNTNRLTKPKMIASLLKAISDGHLVLTDERIIKEAKSYTRHDLLETVTDPRLTTRHFDLLMACAIAWQMKEHAEYTKDKDPNEDRINLNEKRYKPNIYD